MWGSAWDDGEVPVRLSANLGFLWPEIDLPDRIRAAAAAGFDAVECHFPYDHEAAEIAAVLDETTTVMVSLNTGLGANGPDDFGVAARPDRVDEAQRLIAEAVAYAAAVGCEHVSVLAGRTGRADGCEATFVANLSQAAELADTAGVGVLVEPISTVAVADYHCHTVEQGVATIEAVDHPSVSLMLDTFHVGVIGDDPFALVEAHVDRIGHVQIASVPDRREPDHGEVDHAAFLRHLDALGYAGRVGAEYHPRTTTEAGLGWFEPYRRS